MKNIDMTAFFKIGYGLYVVTSHDGTHDNGMICNTVVQVTGEPARLAVTVNKANYTHDGICPICGYVYEGEGRPPADYICPLCKHPDSEFVEE